MLGTQMCRAIWMHQRMVMPTQTLNSLVQHKSSLRVHSRTSGATQLLHSLQLMQQQRSEVLHRAHRYLEVSMMSLRFTLTPAQCTGPQNWLMGLTWHQLREKAQHHQLVPKTATQACCL